MYCIVFVLYSVSYCIVNKICKEKKKSNCFKFIFERSYNLFYFLCWNV